VSGDRDNIPNAASPPAETNSNGASAPVSPTGDMEKKEETEGPKVPRTVISVNGIRQNPTGWDQGERVWGGGIVKYKREGEWQPWPIDLDNESDAFDPSTLMGGAIIPGLLNPVNTQNNIVSSVPVGSTLSSNGAFTHPSLATPQERKQTEYAYSAELSRIDVVPLQTGQGNVHSGAIPPWMVDETGSAIPTITPFASLSERERRGKKQQQPKNDKRKKQKVGANVDREKAVKQVANPNWLPNFGSVWTAGPRSETRRNFELEKPNTRGAQTAKRKQQDM